jgi:hypothetical protein
MIATSSPVNITRAELGQIPAPIGSHSWRPVSHLTVLNQVEDRLSQQGITIIDQQLTVSHGGSRFFGVLHVKNAMAPAGCLPTVGIRNANDQAFACGIAAGLLVICCSNGSFSSDEIALSRRHTTNIMRDLPDLVQSAVHRLGEMWAHQVQQVEAYRGARLSDIRAHDLIVKSLDAGAFSASQIPDVLREYRDSSHEEFQPRTAWSFFNACTEVLKKANPFSLPARTKALHAVCDQYVGLN